MAVTDIQKDPANLTMTVTARFGAPVARVWEVWSDPRQLERWWGPPTYPATVVDHDLRPGGRVTYFMTGPEGDKAHGWWQVRAVDAPHSLEFDDGFADADFNNDDSMPTMVMRVTLEPAGGEETEMRIVTSFPSAEAMEKLVAMGMDEGISAAIGQIDDLVAAPVS